jgi:hypothetical protein
MKLVDVVEEEDQMWDEIQNCKLLQVNWKYNETFWGCRWSSRMGRVLQQLGSQSLLNNLFMVDVEGVEEIEALSAYVVVVDEVAVTPYYLWAENYYLLSPPRSCCMLIFIETPLN